jgi:hypothetical protein
MSESRGGDRSQSRSSLTGLAKEFGQIPASKRRVALEMSAALAGVSLRVSREFVSAAPKAAGTLSAEDLREWAELGRRVAMADIETAVKYFAAGAEPLRPIVTEARHFVFQIVKRQLVLSSSIALETYDKLPALVRDIDDDWLVTEVLRLASEVAGRSAKHSAEFLTRTPPVAAALAAYGPDKREAAEAVVSLAHQFAARTGGMTADLWLGLPEALRNVPGAKVPLLVAEAGRFLEFGGSVTIYFVESGSRVLGIAPDAFLRWSAVAREMGRQGNAVLIAFLRSSPAVFTGLAAAARGNRERSDDSVPSIIMTVLDRIIDIAGSDAESALAAFKSSPAALEQVTIEQFEEWIRAGLARGAGSSSRSRRSYFALETRGSNEYLNKTRLGIRLDDVQPVLRIYVEGLTGKEVDVAPLSAMPQGSRIGDGSTIYLPASVSELEDDELNFKLYKVLAAHAAGQIEFGTFERDTTGLKAAFRDLSDLYHATPEELDAFSLGGYIDSTSSAANRPERRQDWTKGSDYSAVLKVFPEPRLARKIFGTMENARIDNRLRAAYRGLRKDLDLMRDYLRKSRPYIFDLPIHQVPFELLFQITLCGGATDDARRFYGQVVSEIESVVESYLAMEQAAVADSLMATSRVYTLFQNITPEQMQEADSDEEDEEKGEYSYDDKDTAEAVAEDKTKRERPRDSRDISELFNAWNSLDDEGEPDDLSGSEMWTHSEIGEQELESGDEAFSYDEWDRELNDYRVGWSRVIEKKVRHGDRNFVELARSRYRGLISSIRHQFQLMKPENLTRINREYDGEDYDLNAVVDLVIDRKADGRQAENIYTKRLRKMRDVAVSILLDQSSSTARTITRNPLQPYTHPGRRIIEIEKEGLVLMSEALEAVGDVYSINGFTSEGRRNVKFYVVKDFAERYSEDIEKRIGGITFQNNTRLGAAIRHAAAKLLRQDARTKLLIILTDGRPYDHDYGDARYAREDVREALTEAKTSGITPFCITVDRESESELRDLYGDVGYTIIDDVLSLPERMPNIYRRLTS